MTTANDTPFNSLAPAPVYVYGVLAPSIAVQAVCAAFRHFDDGSPCGEQDLDSDAVWTWTETYLFDLWVNDPDQNGTPFEVYLDWCFCSTGLDLRLLA